jgi:hypothetical protein
MAACCLCLKKRQTVGYCPCSCFALPSCLFHHLPYCLIHLRLRVPIVFVRIPWGQRDLMWKEFCFQHSDIRTANDREGNEGLTYSASSWKWNRILVYHENPLPPHAVHRLRCNGSFICHCLLKWSLRLFKYAVWTLEVIEFTAVQYDIAF